MNGNLTPLGDLLAAADEFEAKGSKLADSLRLLAGELWLRRQFVVGRTVISHSIPKYQRKITAEAAFQLVDSFCDTQDILAFENFQEWWENAVPEVTKRLITGDLVPNGPQEPEDHDEDNQQP